MRAAVYKAVCCYKFFNRKADIHDLPDLERYFKYRLILLDENYQNYQNILYVNKNAHYDKIWRMSQRLIKKGTRVLNKSEFLGKVDLVSDDTQEKGILLEAGIENNWSHQKKNKTSKAI